jgi:hypothetical protein
LKMESAGSSETMVDAYYNERSTTLTITTWIIGYCSVIRLPFSNVRN